jgi:hypothetical protein
MTSRYCNAEVIVSQFCNAGRRTLTFDAKLADTGGGHERGEAEDGIHAQGVTCFGCGKGEYD